MECPNCRLLNPDTARVCDCGFDFARGRLGNEGHESRRASRLRQTGGCEWGCMFGAVGGVLGGGVGLIKGALWAQHMAGASESAVGAVLLCLLVGAAIGLAVGAPLGFLLRVLWLTGDRTGRR